MSLGAATTLILVSSIGGVAMAQEHATPEPPVSQVGDGEPAPEPPMDELAGSEMLLFEDLPVVVSASRREQLVTESAVPISVITSEDIRYRGMTKIPEMLRFVPGVDVLRSDRNRYSLGVRGLHQEYADRTLFLINGRHAGNPLTGGVDYQQLPLFPQDIDRIEVVRGPGGAAWGANAFNGVVNVIPKSPSETLGTLAATTWTAFGDSFTHVRHGDKNGDLTWRASFGYESQVPSEDAIDDADFEARDFSRRYLFDSLATYDLDDDTVVTFGLGVNQLERGGAKPKNSPRPADQEFTGVRSFVRLDRDLDGGDSMYVRWFGNYADDDRESLWNAVTTENDLEAQWDTTMGADDEHRVSLGGNARIVTVDNAGDLATHSLVPGYDNELWLGAFAIDHWRWADQFTLETQARIDYYSETKTDWSGRLTGLYALDRNQHHVLRAATGKAFRAPAAALRNLTILRGQLPSPPFPPETYAVEVRSNDGLENEQVYFGEFGYNAAWTESFISMATLYYNSYEDLISGQSVADPLMMGRQIVEVDNIDGAEG